MSAFNDVRPIQGKDLSPGKSVEGFTIPLGSLTAGRLIFTDKAAGVTLLGGADRKILVHGRLTRPVSWVGFERGTVMIGPLGPAAASQPTEIHTTDDVFTLNGFLPWEIEFRLGTDQLIARLDGLLLRSLKVLGVASQIRLELGRLEGTAYLYLADESSQVTIHRPREAGVKIFAPEGISELTLDGQRFGNFRRDAPLESTGFQSKPDWYEISFAGLADQVTIDYPRRSEVDG